MELYPLRAGESIEVRAFSKGSDQRKQTFVSSWEQVFEVAAEWDLDYDVYFGVAPRVPGPDGKLHGRAENVERIPVVWCDLDAKGDFTKEDRLRQIETFPPTVLVDSGGGFHAFWRLDRDLTPEQGRMVMKHLAAHFCCDDVSDPARILRVPTTRNHKYDPPRFVDIVSFSTNGPWNPEALPKGSLSLLPSTSTDREKRAQLIEQQGGIPESGTTIDGENFAGRDSTIFEYACYLRDQHKTYDEVLEACLKVNITFIPPLNENEVTGRVKSAFTREAPPLITEVIEPVPTQATTTSSNALPTSRFQTVSIHELGDPVKPVWLWEPYFLLNRLVLLDGEEGIGKGLLLCMLAAKFSKEYPFVWFTAEDDPQDDIKPRIRAALEYYGAGSLSDVNVHFVRGDPRFNAENTALFDMLEKTVEAVDARVLVFDPGRSFIGPREGQRDFSYNNEADIRPTMQRLNQLSRDTNVAIPFVHHHNKNAAAPLRYRTTGTGAWRQVVRHQVTMLWDYKSDDGVFGVQKSNIGPTGFVRPYRHEVVDDYAVIVPSDQLDPAPELEIWAQDRAKHNKTSVLVMEADDIVEQVRDWAFANLAPGEDFPNRSALMQSTGLSQEPVKVAIQVLREEKWIVRPKGRQGGGYIWDPKWQPGDGHE